MSEAERHAAYVKSDSYKAYQANMAAWQKKQEEAAWLENADKTEAERLADYKATPEYIKRAETWAAWDAEQERKKQAAESLSTSGKGLGLAAPVAYLLSDYPPNDPHNWPIVGPLIEFFEKLFGWPAHLEPSTPLPTPAVGVTPFVPNSTPMPTSTLMPTPMLMHYQQYKAIGTLTEWELRVGGQVAHNAHSLLAQANQFYFWSDDDPGQNSDPPVPLNYDKNLPISLDPAAYKRSWRGSQQDIYEYTGGRTPFVCGDVPDWTYYLAGYNLTSHIPQSDAGYPNRWARSAYGYERMLQLIRLGGIEGKSEIWDIQSHGDNYMFTHENVPELGDIVVTKTSNNLQIPDAGHVVTVAEVHGLSPDQIIIFEGNPDDGTLVIHSLEDLKNRIPDLKYVIYGHPNLP